MQFDTLNPATLMSGRYRQEDIPSLIGKTAIVTGGDNGIGYYTSLALAKAGAKVILTGLTHDHGVKAEAEINAAAATAGGRAIFHHVDQGDLQSVNAWAKSIVDKEDRLDILINNAGLGQTEHALTKDGLESKYAVNNLAHFVITLRLLPLLEKTAAISPPYSVRIVIQSSEMHRFAPGDTTFASVDEINEPRDPAREYSRSKLGLIFFAKELVKRKLSDSTIVVTSVHPGTVDTDLQGTWGATYGVPGQVAESAMRAVGKSAAEGAEPCLWLATTTEITENNFIHYQGKYFDDAHGKPDGETDQAKDGLVADNWWRLTSTQAQEILGETF
jgi:NAD(P)-dependent dehydrogenase (short-subunit alcohol dehydrogenase family)